MRPRRSSLPLAASRCSTDAPSPISAGATPPASAERASAAGVAAAAWGVAGQLLLLAIPTAQLLRAALRGFATTALDPTTVALSAAFVAAFCFFQGYRGFQRKYAPLVAARAAHLARHPRPLYALLAPLYACGLVHATRRRRVGTALLFAVMPMLAVLVGLLPEPWRAIVDLGVACGLAWGTISVLVLSLRAAAGCPPAIALDLPPASER